MSTSGTTTPPDPAEPSGTPGSISSNILGSRLDKLARIRARGVDPYPPRARRTHSSAQALAAWDAQPVAADGYGPEVSVAGRVVAMRGMGKSSFAHILDGDGRIQLYLKKDVLGDAAYAAWDDVDLGDFVDATGPLFRTRTGEVTVEVRRWSLLAKALRPLPDKWHGLTDTETRFRQRYLDLIANREVKATFETRSRIIAAIRRFFSGRGFLEVDTPVLNAHAGGAAARPFLTHHNALDRELALRIALELHLKRLLVGGFDKVFELGRVFRNEGIDADHNPEFTLLESYEAYADYTHVAAMVEELVSSVAREVLGSTVIQWKGHTIDLAPPWRRVTMRDAIREHTGIDFLEVPQRDQLAAAMRAIGLPVPAHLGWGKLLDELFSERVEPHLIQPTFLLDYPVELSPLAKRHPDDPRLVERFEAFVAGEFEIANAYTELNDPQDQRARFEEQVRLQAAGDDEAELVDEDFLVALEHGMPPAGGLGIGIDRLVMLLTGQRSIREVILFPQLRSR